MCYHTCDHECYNERYQECYHECYYQCCHKCYHHVDWCAVTGDRKHWGPSLPTIPKRVIGNRGFLFSLSASASQRKKKIKIVLNGDFGNLFFLWPAWGWWEEKDLNVRESVVNKDRLRGDKKHCSPSLPTIPKRVIGKTTLFFLSFPQWKGKNKAPLFSTLAKNEFPRP